MRRSQTLIDVNARNTGADVAEDLVRNGLREVRVVPCGDGFCSRATDEGDFVADGDTGNVSDVDHGHVHSDSADDVGEIFAHDDAAAVGELAIEAIRISDG